MEEAELRDMAAALRADLAAWIPDPAERATVDAALRQALDTAPGSAKPALRAALTSHPQARRWVADRLPAEVERAVDIPFDPTVTLGVLFVCPQEDFDYVRENVADSVPPCPKHHVPLLRTDG
jgi:hypothetical protein